LVEALAPLPAERFLDLACGTGGVAIVAARAGADVVGLDFSAEQLVKAHAASAAAGLSIQFDEGDAQDLPYGDASFAAVASCFGVIFAPDRARAAAELVRVAQPGCRIAITSWTDDAWDELGRSVGRESMAGEHAWAREAVVRDLLGDAFDLRFEGGEWRVTADSADALWELMSTSAPPLKVFLDGLDADRRDEVRRRYVEFFGPGELRRVYVLILGKRR
jgi:ubiquinone/menaquinone biosynthesis C-methylase UbiE